MSDSGPVPYYNTANAQANAPVACQPGYYQGWMSWYIQGPPGYTPPSDSGSGYGTKLYLEC
ncbi:MAG: hypothetical protein ACR2PL_16210 [Dehalococcoidia bacterium]